MTPENELAQLRRDVRFVKDRIEIEGFIKGTSDRNDLSYTRPLQLDSEPVERW